jgi:hypothetical protein
MVSLGWLLSTRPHKKYGPVAEGAPIVHPRSVSRFNVSTAGSWKQFLSTEWPMRLSLVCATAAVNSNGRRHRQGEYIRQANRTVLLHPILYSREAKKKRKENTNFGRMSREPSRSCQRHDCLCKPKSVNGDETVTAITLYIIVYTLSHKRKAIKMLSRMSTWYL